jgi:long-subunit acyl-CoA synthetase (AMP-forming)
MERIGFDITHVYGLTETYGPASVYAKSRKKFQAFNVVTFPKNSA